MNHQIAEPNPFVKAEQSRRLHDLLADYDAALRDLEANPTRYTVANYDRCFKSITRLREQTLKAIQDLTR